MRDHNIDVSGGQRTSAEEQEAGLNKGWFDLNPGSWEEKMQNFPKYVSWSGLARIWPRHG